MLALVISAAGVTCIRLVGSQVLLFHPGADPGAKAKGTAGGASER